MKTKLMITGSGGMLGRALRRKLTPSVDREIIAVTRQMCDLEDAASVDRLFALARPTHVYHVAAKVGGIKANAADPVGFLLSNLKSEMFVYEACLKHRVRKVAFAGSSCIYPRACPQPMKEESLLTGPLEPTNEGYALAKIVGLKLAAYAHAQHGLVSVCPMFCNLYGPGDSFDLERCHVLSALVRRFSEAATRNTPSVTLWGTGNARREFLHVDDAADAMIWLMEKYHSSDIINVGAGEDVSIRELATMVREVVGYTGGIEWDVTKPDGMPRKCMDVSRMRALGLGPAIPLREGVRQVVAEFRRLAGAESSP